jgi:hypothetical protein
MASAHERRRRAVQAAVAIASAYGIDATGARVLNDSNNTVVHLAPAPLVAKVATTTIRADAEEALEREVSVALHLSVNGAPIVVPSLEPPAGPHRQDGAAISLWTYRRHTPADERDAAAAGTALRSVHAALADYPGALPPFTDQLDHAEALLGAYGRLPSLSVADRALLDRSSERVRAALVEHPAPSHPLHGEAHLGNLIRVGGRLLWLDFESACTGPLEWDLSSLPGGAITAFQRVDGPLLDVLRVARSFCVAVWCVAQPGRAPEVDEAAAVHLSLLRRAAA